MLKTISLAALLLFTSSTLLAQYDNQRKERSPSAYGSRDTRIEATAVYVYQNGVNKDTDGGSSLDVDSTSGWGLGVGWNWTGHVNLSYRFLSAKPDYLAEIVPEDPLDGQQSIENRMTKTSHQLNLTYHFRDKALTPFITGGVGLTKVNSNILSGLPDVGCWWDPWWGYICYSDWKTYSTTEFSYNLGLGVRWEINNAVFTRAAYNKEFISLKNGTLDFDMATVEVGLMF